MFPYYMTDVLQHGANWVQSMVKLKRNLLALEVVLKKLTDMTPLSDKNRRKALRVLSGGWFGSTRRNLFQMKKNFDNVREAAQSVSEGANSKLKRAKKKWMAEELHSHVANIISMMSRGGQFHRALRDREYVHISAAELHAVLTSIDGVLVVISNTIPAV